MSSRSSGSNIGGTVHKALWSLVVALAAICQGCGVSGPTPLNEPGIRLRRDIFHGSPIWESRLFDKTATVYAGQRRAAGDPSIAALAKVSRYSAPGLYVLLKQVRPSSPLLATDKEDAQILTHIGAMATSQNNVSLYGTTAVPSDIAMQFDLNAFKTRSDDFVAQNDSPLPDTLKQEPLAEWFIVSLSAAYFNSNVKKLSAGSDTTEARLPEKNFTLWNVRRFGEKFMEVNFEMIQPPKRADKSGKRIVSNDASRRWERVSRMAAGGDVRMNSTALPITWDGLALQYFTAYYKGSFVDRTGGKLAKPDLGKKISNETITTAATVGLESIYDFAVLASSKGPAEKAIKAPVVFSGTASKPEWETAGHVKPTLVVVTQKLLKKKKADDIEEWPFVVESLKGNDKVGISAAKLKVVRFLSGVAGDGAGSLSDLITRTFGGIDIGFVLLGKVSVGDNDTLAKLVQTVVENFAHRASELAASHVLYDVEFNSTSPDWNNDSLIVLLVKFVAAFDGDSADE
jgi:hypothetical protein